MLLYVQVFTMSFFSLCLYNRQVVRKVGQSFARDRIDGMVKRLFG
jgi:hypothetical protein